MAVKGVVPRHTFTERAAKEGLNDSELLNSNNVGGREVPDSSDVVIAGGGIHGLIYGVHAAKKNPGKLNLTLIEKNKIPGYKVGESTLPSFSMWMKMNGLSADYMLRIFGLKDGLYFYFLDPEQEKEYKEFLILGTPGTDLSGFQLERPISELLLTLMAQRTGINVYHDRKIDFGSSKVDEGVQNSKIEIAAGKNNSNPASTINTSLMVDATGRFRQYASKNASLHRFDGFNTDSFWGYFTSPTDETKIPFRNYEGTHTNHLCFPEGWFWVIRLISWQGNPISKMMDMLTYLLDCSEAGIPSDQVPSIEELAKMFDLKYQWVTSIGVAARNDVKYPDDIASYGSTEAERKFNYFVRKYPLITEFMTNFELIENLYGPGTTWFVRKTLTYQSPVVSGPGWLAVGDACGFTNPLWSPGINVGMASSTYAAELTHKIFENYKPGSYETNGHKIETPDQVLEPYRQYVKNLIPALDKMNRFNYLCFRDKRLGAQVSCVWQYLAGSLSVPSELQGTFTLNQDNFIQYALNWRWGSKVPEYETMTKKVIEVLGSIPLDEPVPEEKVLEIIEFSNTLKRKVIDSGRIHNIRFAGKLRTFDQKLNYQEDKKSRDFFTRQCVSCRAWGVLRSDWTKCPTCGNIRTPEEGAIIRNPPLEAY